MRAYTIKRADGTLDGKAIYDTKRGAMANWLVTDRKMKVCDFYSDNLIEGIFNIEADDAKASLVELTVHETAHIEQKAALIDGLTDKYLFEQFENAGGDLHGHAAVIEETNLWSFLRNLMKSVLVEGS